jgi:ribosome-binding factor A
MSDRMRRVNAAVREVLSEAVGELKDPRIGFVTVTGVETSTDLRQAVVFVSVLGSERKREKTIEGLQAAHGILQGRIARELRLKRTPQLTFEYDPSVERGVRMTQLIDELAPDDPE